MVAVLAIAAGMFFRHAASARERAQQRPAAPPPSVSTATASRGQLGVYLDALGTVTPLATVTVKTRVDGQLMSVNYREGQMVKAGDVLAELDARPYQAQLTQAQGQLGRDQALLENARVDLGRYQVLSARDAIPQQQLATQQALVRQYAATVEYDRGQIEAAKVNLIYCRITSPVSGRVGLRLIDPGNIVQTTDTTGLVVITQLEPITVVFSVAEDYLPQIRQQLDRGQTLPVVAFDRSRQSRISSGQVLTYDSQIDPTTGTIKVKAIFSNRDDALFPNQFVNARLQLAMHRDATLVPTAAIQRNGQSAFVYLVKPDQTVSSQKVTVGAIDGETAEITQGLASGETIAANNFDKLQDGMRISMRSAVADAAGSSPR